MASNEIASNKKEVKEQRQGRPYQVDLVEYAKHENTIVSLGTGAGKTFVAVMLIREYASLTKDEFTDEKGQRIIFLAHTVPLVKQQASYIRENTNLKVTEFVGDVKSGIDNWPKSTWYNHFNINNVLVFSRAIFLDLLTKGYIRPRQLALIVFDECHHATKNDPFVQIMKIVKDAPEEERPRILGLSASLLGQKVRPGELKKGVKGLETILMSRARTAPDLTEVVKFATNPDEKITHYSTELDKAGSRLKQILSGPLTFLESNVRKGKFPIEETAKNLLDDLYHILVDLGPASACDFVGQTLSELRKSLETNDPADKWEEMIGYLVLSQLIIFEQECVQLKKDYGPRLQDSKKVRSMLLQLADSAVRSGEGENYEEKVGGGKATDRQELRGIIFTERRHTASCLCKLLQEKSKSDPELKHIRCDYVVGHNVGQNTTAMRKEAHMNSKKQDQVLHKFRKGVINLLIATSVIEEGVDVPRCNLVVRFDLPQNFRAYLQSKGRARDKPSTFLLLVSDEQGKYVEDINNYHILEKELIDLCQSDRPLPSEEEIQAKMADKVSPYMPNGREGARVTVGNSLTHLHRYCGNLPHDIYTKPSPNFEVTKIFKTGGHASQTRPLCLEEEEEDPKYNYICKLRLPVNCPCKETIESPPLGSKLQSKRAAALYAMEKLHKMAEVDERFKAAGCPDSDDEGVKKEKSKPENGTDRKCDFYKTDIHSSLTNCLINPSYLYVFIITVTSTGQLYNSSQGIGILTTDSLRHEMIPPYSLYVKDNTTEGEIELTVTLKLVQSSLLLTSEELIIYRECHEAIFTNILMIASHLKLDFKNASKNYIVVPVTINSNVNQTKIDLANIDFDTAGLITSKISEKIFPEKPYENLNESLVTPAHRDPMTPLGITELFRVQVDPSITPLSPFSIAKYKSYSDFFAKKYNFPLHDETQPGLECTRVNTSYFKLFVSRYHQGDTTLPTATTDKKSTIIMFPETVHVFPVGVHFWRILRCLPSVLWRLESLLIANELGRQIRAETEIGFLTIDSTLLADTPVKGYTDAGHGKISSIIINRRDKGSHGNICHDNKSPEDLSKRGPGCGLILQALTPKGANDSINLERLELLADSFLKLITSIYLFNSRPNDHEGKLSCARSRRVSNVNLFILAKNRELTNKIMGSDFNIDKTQSGNSRTRWVPPGYVFSSSEKSELYTHTCLSDKSVADTVEALIGAHLVAGGLEGGVWLLKWLGVKVGGDELYEIPKGDVKDSSDTPLIYSNSSCVIYSNSSCVFTKHFGAPPILSPPPVLTKEVHNLLSKVNIVQQKIKYTFKNILLLIEAMTHSSYSWNHLTDCYQRLEFLGDAILDYLITCHIYQSDSSADPGKMTELRSALVCNAQFSELAVSLELHKSLLHSSPNLFKDISDYAKALKERKGDKDVVYLNEIIGKTEMKVVGSEEDYEVTNEEEDETSDPPKPLSDCFEALVGAVFLDNNMSLQQVWKVFFPFLEPLIEEFKSNPPSTAISLLYKRKPNGIKVTKQTLQNTIGLRRTYKSCCIIEVEIDGRKICESSIAASYKNAKNQAALKILQKIEMPSDTKVLS